MFKRNLDLEKVRADIKRKEKYETTRMHYKFSVLLASVFFILVVLFVGLVTSGYEFARPLQMPTAYYIVGFFAVCGCICVAEAFFWFKKMKIAEKDLSK